MGYDTVIICLLIIIILLLVDCMCQKEGFSLSKKPMEHDNHMVMENPFDNIDYITPVFQPI